MQIHDFLLISGVSFARQTSRTALGGEIHDFEQKLWFSSPEIMIKRSYYCALWKSSLIQKPYKLHIFGDFAKHRN